MFAASLSNFVCKSPEFLWKKFPLGSVKLLDIAQFHLLVSDLFAESACRCFRAGLTGRCPAVRPTTSWTRLRPSSLSCAASRRPSAAARRRGRTSSRSSLPSVFLIFRPFAPPSGRLHFWHWPLVADVAQLHPFVKACFFPDVNPHPQWEVTVIK